MPPNLPVEAISISDDKTYTEEVKTKPDENIEPEKEEVEVDKVEKKEIVIPPELEKAFYCESHGKHEENGKVVIHENDNGTLDVGIGQINSVHFPKMKEMGLDPYVKEDNIAFSKLLYKEQGLKPWYGIDEKLNCVWEYEE